MLLVLYVKSTSFAKYCLGVVLLGVAEVGCPALYCWQVQTDFQLGFLRLPERAEVLARQVEVEAWALAELPGHLLMLQQMMSCTAEVSLLVGYLKESIAIRLARA